MSIHRKRWICAGLDTEASRQLLVVGRGCSQVASGFLTQLGELRQLHLSEGLNLGPEATELDLESATGAWRAQPAPPPLPSLWRASRAKPLRQLLPACDDP